MSTDDTTGTYADLPGRLRLYHEVHGEGFPTILLHGGIGASEMFGEALALLAEGRQVIAVHLQGHGRTPDVDRPLRYEDLADDVAALAAHLGHDRVDLVGYSFGGGVAARTAVGHPGLVRRLVLASQALRRDAWFPEVRAQLDQMEAAAAEIGPTVQAGPLGELHPEVDFTALFAKMGALERRDYDWTAEVAALACPVLLLMADADAFDPAHYVAVFQALGGGRHDPGLAERIEPLDRETGLANDDRTRHRLAIVPGATHYDLFSSPWSGAVIAGFLDA